MSASPTSTRSSARRLAHCREGSVAVEFALVGCWIGLVLMIVVDLCWQVYGRIKSTEVAAAMAEAVARSGSVTTAELADIVAGGAAMARPFTVDAASVSITLLTQNAPGVWEKVWRYGATAAAGADTALQVDSAIGTTEDILVTEVAIDVAPLVGVFVSETSTYRGRSMQRPRWGTVALNP